MKKKLKTLLLCTLAMSMLLCGCSATVPDETTSETTNTSTKPKSGTVDLTVWCEQDTFPLVEEMVESFKSHYAKDATFNITLEHYADADMKNNVLADVHGAGDVFSFPDDQFSSLLAAGVLSPVPDSDAVYAANLEDAATTASYEGTMYAYPYTADNGYFLYYDKSYFTPEDVSTLDGIMAVAEANGKKVSMQLDSGWYMYSFFGQTGLNLGINEDGLTNNCNWNTTDGAVSGLDVAKAIEKFISSPSFAMRNDEILASGFRDGGLIAGVSGTWSASAVSEALGDNYGAVKLPTYDCDGQPIQMATFVGYKMFGVNHYSDNVEWAHKLANWFSNEENQALRLEKRSQGPSNKIVAESDAVKSNEAIAAILDESQYGTIQRIGGKYWQPCTDFIMALVAKDYTDAEMQSLLDELVSGITASVAN